ESTLMLVSVGAYTALVGVSQMVTILTSELYPTSVRSLGSSMGYLSNNLGNCVPPLLEMLLPTQDSHASLLVYASLALFNCYLSLHLPETNERRLYDTVDELVDEER
ncbi:Major facilitator sugar transporter-like, partial [Trinorchestia longiramus]